MDNSNHHVVQSHKDREEKDNCLGGHKGGGGKLQGESSEPIPAREKDNLVGSYQQDHNMGRSV